MIVLSVPIYARYRLSGIFRQKTRLHQPRRSKFYLRLSCYYKIQISPSVTSLRGRCSKGKGKGIRARDHARGRSDSCLPRAPKFPLPLPLLTPAEQTDDISRRCHWFPRKMTCEERAKKNSILMTYHYPDMGRASDWLCCEGICFNQSEALPRSGQSRHQSGISALVPHMSIGRRRLLYCILLSNILLSVVAWNGWNDHVLDWWKHKDDPNVLFLKYEDLHKVILQFPSNQQHKNFYFSGNSWSDTYLGSHDHRIGVRGGGGRGWGHSGMLMLVITDLIWGVQSSIGQQNSL